MTEKRDDGAGIRRTPPPDADEACRRESDQAEREDDFDRSMKPKSRGAPARHPHGERPMSNDHTRTEALFLGMIALAFATAMFPMSSVSDLQDSQQPPAVDER